MSSPEFDVDAYTAFMDQYKEITGAWDDGAMSNIDFQNAWREGQGGWWNDEEDG